MCSHATQKNQLKFPPVPHQRIYSVVTVIRAIKCPPFILNIIFKTERILYYSIIFTASCSNAIFDWRFFIKFISVGLHWLECGYLILEPPHRSGSRCGSRSRGVKSLENISLKSPKSGWICIFCKKLNFVSNICKFSDFESILWSYSSQLNKK